MQAYVCYIYIYIYICLSLSLSIYIYIHTHTYTEVYTYKPGNMMFNLCRKELGVYSYQPLYWANGQN